MRNDIVPMLTILGVFVFLTGILIVLDRRSERLHQEAQLFWTSKNCPTQQAEPSVHITPLKKDGPNWRSM